MLHQGPLDLVMDTATTSRASPIQLRLDPPVQSLFHEQAKSIVAIQELQNEVSSLLEFKNALLETFPHLQGKLNHSNSVSSLVRNTNSNNVIYQGNNSSSKAANQQQDPELTPRVQRTDAATLSDEYGSITAHVRTGSTAHGSHGTPGKKMRKSPEGSSAGAPGSSVIDSGFSTDHNKDHASSSGLSTLLSPSAAARVFQQQQNIMSDVRWDMWGDTSPSGALIGNSDDELFNLLDIIHRKTIRLRREAEIREANHYLTLTTDLDMSRFGRQSNIPQSTPTQPNNAISTLRAISEGSEMLPERDIASPANKLLDHQEKFEMLRKEREFLLKRVIELETTRGAGTSEGSELVRTRLQPAAESLDHNGKPAGIVHSVQIRTGAHGHEDVTDPHHVNIEIKQSKKSTNRHSVVPNSSPALGGVSVVNLRGSADNLSPYNSSQGKSSRSYSFNEPKISHNRPKLFQGRIAVPSSRDSNHKLSPPQLNRVLSNKNLNPKSRSVENLFADGQAVLGLKSANSEMNVMSRGLAASSRHLADHKFRPRLIGTTSELNMSKLGATEKLRLEGLDGIVSMPAELTKGLRHRVKPNRDKIRQVLKMNSVIDLQRQLLTTVMENEVYKTQLESVSESWLSKMGSYEEINSNLSNEVKRLNQENEELKIKMNRRLVELESTKSGIQGLVQKVEIPNPAMKKSSTHGSERRDQVEIQSENATAGESAKAPNNLLTKSSLTQTPKAENHVHFDVPPLHQRKTTSQSNLTIVEGLRPPPRRPVSQLLPGDARQRLEEMASKGTSTRKYSSPSRIPTNIAAAKQNAKKSEEDPALELITNRFNYPLTSQSTKPSSSVATTLVTTSTLTKPITMFANNNIQSSTKPVQQRLVISNQIPQMEQNLNVKNDLVSNHKSNNNNNHHQRTSQSGFQSSPQPIINHGGNMMPATSFSSDHLDHTKKDSTITEKELKNMGRDTIANIIAGILKKYSQKNEEVDETAFNHQELAEQVQKLSNSSYSITSSSVTTSMARPSWEANNYLEEFTHALHQRKKNMSPLRSVQQSPQQLPEHNYKDSLTEDLYHDSLLNDNTDVRILNSFATTASDSLQEKDCLPHDSLSFEENIFMPNNDEALIEASSEFYDSIVLDNRSKEHRGGHGNKKLIIPYDDSFSSNTSPYTSNDSISGKPPEDNLNLLHHNNHHHFEEAQNVRMTRLLPVIPSSKNRPYYKSNPDLTLRSPVPDRNFTSTPPCQKARPKSQLNMPTSNLTLSPTRELSPYPNSRSQQSLMKIATEKMKRKILGWS